MVIGKILKRKKEKVKEESKKKKEPEKKETKQTKKEQKVSLEKKGGLAWRILKEPHITEKATFLAQENQYVFKVFPDANKTETKKAIEELYGVEVESVRIINVPKKRRRLGRIEGWRKGYKKAVVKLKPGQKIEIIPR